MRSAFAWRGGLFADRYHMRVLKTPREVRNAIRYVLLNAARHRRGALRTRIDPASSGRWFDGWKRGAEQFQRHPEAQAVAAAHTWLLAEGWRSGGLIDPSEVPGEARASPG